MRPSLEGPQVSLANGTRPTVASISFRNYKCEMWQQKRTRILLVGHSGFSPWHSKEAVFWPSSSPSSKDCDLTSHACSTRICGSFSFDEPEILLRFICGQEFLSLVCIDQLRSFLLVEFAVALWAFCQYCLESDFLDICCAFLYRSGLFTSFPLIS